MAKAWVTIDEEWPALSVTTSGDSGVEVPKKLIDKVRRAREARRDAEFELMEWMSANKCLPDDVREWMWKWAENAER